MSMATDFGDALRKAREAKDMSKAQVGRDLNISASAVSQWEAGRTKPELENFLRIATAFDIVLSNTPFREYYIEKTGVDPVLTHVDPEVMLAFEAADFSKISSLPIENNTRQALNAPPFSSIAGLARDIPVYGIAVGGDDADFRLNGQETDRAIRPPALADAKDVFALYVSNDSMYPAWRENALIYVTPHRPPAIGDDVIIELKPTDDGEPGRAFLKRLKARTPTKYVVEQFNPPGEREFDRAEVLRIYRVIPLEEALGLS